jgi:tRNA threonylcarbamoyladenosine biosynthesis protein TsaE
VTDWVYEAADEEATERLGQALAACLPPGSVVALCGTLGAGKTRLVQAVAAASGVARQAVVSPTFVLCQHYAGRQPIYHLDAYRLRDAEEWRAIGVDELWQSPAWKFIEWADRVAAALPEEYLQIEMVVTGPTARRVIVRAVGPRYQAVVERLGARMATAG